MNTIHFLLTPDHSSSRLVKRIIAEKASRINVIAGTWTELIEQALKAYLLPDPEDIWNEKLSETAASVKEAFWEKSMEVASDETLASIGANLTMLIDGVGPAGKIVPDTKKVLPERARKHLADLAKLHEDMGGVLPIRLAAIRSVLDAGKDDVLSAIVLYRVEGLPLLSPWQKALIDKIEKDFPPAKDKELEGLLSQALAPAPPKKRPKALAAIQDNLFKPGAESVKLDESVQWLAVRDCLEEAEVAAGMVQTIMKEQKLKPAEIGLLVPSNKSYADAIHDAFSFAGIPVSGLDSSRKVRDLGREAVLNFLFTRRWPAPVMALAALYSNPLMPWKAKTGIGLANEVMNGRFDPWLPKDASSDDRNMADLIKKRDPATPAELAQALRDFGGLLNGSEALEEHQSRAQDLLLELAMMLPKAGEIPWKKLLAHSSPSSFPTKDDEVLVREGVAAFAEDEEPSRQVKYLIVFGFSSGRYPAGSGTSPVFFESDLTLLKEKLGYAVESGADDVLSRRNLLRRQLLSATEGITFLIPRRDMVGDELHPSDTLPFMAKLYNPPKGREALEAGNLLLELDTEEGKAAARWLALAKPATAGEPWKTVIADLNLGRDLLTTIRVDDEGKPRPESPSMLEWLMVSPLGWLLARAGLVPSEWGPEELNVALKGTIAHSMLEYFFNDTKAIPKPAVIRRETPKQFGIVIREVAPFLDLPEWSIEKRHLEQEILEAALWWRERLIQFGAKMLGAEAKLNGQYDGVALTGKTDLLLQVSGGQLFVVDYKKSSSAKFRTMMQEGYASQVALYRKMLETGDYTASPNKALAEALAKKIEIGVLYALLNDRKVLTDSKDWLGTGQQDVTEMGRQIADQGLALLSTRFRDLRKGLVPLNKDVDEEWYAENTGITATYALDASPLVRLFMHASEPAGEAEE
jgi:hypothetical protein